MTIITNASGQFGVTQFVVSKATGRGSYETIGAAISAAAAAGGGEIYVEPGEYTEDLNISAVPLGISITSTFTGYKTDPITTIYGKINYIGGVSSLIISNFYLVDVSGSGDHITMPDGGTAAFKNCKFQKITGDASFRVGSISSFTTLSIDSSVLTLWGTEGIVLEGSSNFSFISCNIENFNSFNVFPIVDVKKNSTINSTLNFFTMSGGSPAFKIGDSTTLFSTTDTFSGVKDSTVIHYWSAAKVYQVGAFANILDGTTSQSDFFVKSDGAFGMYCGEVVFLGANSAQTVDPNVTKEITRALPVPVPSTDGQIIIGKTGEYPQAATLTAGAGVSITNGAGSITISSIPVSPTWNVITASQTLAANNGYIVASGDLVLTLPATSAVGDLIDIVLDNGSSWQIAQNAGQRIRLGSSLTLLGTGGSLASTASGDAISLVCTQANTMWCTVAVQGNITIT